MNILIIASFNQYLNNGYLHIIYLLTNDPKQSKSNSSKPNLMWELFGLIPSKSIIERREKWIEQKVTDLIDRFSIRAYTYIIYPGLSKSKKNIIIDHDSLSKSKNLNWSGKKEKKSK